MISDLGRMSSIFYCSKHSFVLKSQLHSIGSRNIHSFGLPKDFIVDSLVFFALFWFPCRFSSSELPTYLAIDRTINGKMVCKSRDVWLGVMCKWPGEKSQ